MLNMLNYALHTSYGFLLTNLLLYYVSRKLENEQVWLWPYEALGIVGFELNDITFVCGLRI